jgi:hypothetical protein
MPKPPTVVFLNEPKQTEHEADEEFNARRKSLALEVRRFVLNHAQYRDRRVEVTFSQNGISSLVCILDTDLRKHVLKVPLKTGYSRNEGVFLRAWESVGVKVPRIVEEGDLDGQPYLLMEYIDALTLSKVYSIDQLIANRTYTVMGRTLRMMHEATSIGYGDIVDGRAEYPNIRTWLENSQLKEKIKYVQKHQLLEEDAHGALADAYAVVYSAIGDSASTVYGHSDFHIGNIFATEPLTVFDPIPFLNHPYMDLARSIVLSVKMDLNDTRPQLIEGYFGNESYDGRLLQACIILNAYQKLKYWHQVKREEDIKSLREHLAATQPLLN